MTLNKLLETNIKKLTKPLKNEDELIRILKRKLTKKEYKTMLQIAEELPEQEQIQKLNLNEKRYKEIKTKLFKKINFPNLKEELMQDKKD